jgi:uncharacterized protein YjbI with pentapeptide repeats
MFVIKDADSRVMQTIENKGTFVESLVAFIKTGVSIDGACLRHVDFSNSDLSGLNLSGVDLVSANLSNCNLEKTNLSGSNLVCAKMTHSELSEANLSNADLRQVDLSYSNLEGAKLCRARLENANLSYSCLMRADLAGVVLFHSNISYANFRGATLTLADFTLCHARKVDLSGVNIEGAIGLDAVIAETRILCEGDIVGWKKCRNGILVKLLVPAEAKRSSAFSRRCRAEYVKVLEVIDPVGDRKEGVSIYDNSIVYREGEIVIPDSFDNRWTDEYTNGIHFFITKIEAAAY